MDQTQRKLLLTRLQLAAPSMLALQRMQLLQSRCLSNELKDKIASNKAEALRRKTVRATARHQGRRPSKSRPNVKGPDSGSETENEEPRGVTGLEAAVGPLDDDS